MFDENYSTNEARHHFDKMAFRNVRSAVPARWCHRRGVRCSDVVVQLLMTTFPLHPNECTLMSRANSSSSMGRLAPFIHIKQRFSVLNTTEAAAERRLRRRPMKLLLASNKKWGQHAPTTAVTDLIHECSPFLYYIYTMLDHKHKNVPSSPLVFLWA